MLARARDLLLPSSVLVLCAAFSAPGRETRPEHEAVRGEAQLEEWPSLRAAVEASRRAIRADDGGYAARMPAQGWTARFDVRGATVEPDAGGWSFGLELVRWGRAGDERAVGAPAGVRTTNDELTRDWDDALSEWYRSGARGLEHGFTLRARPAGEGPLSLVLALHGGLLPRVEEGRRDVLLVDAGGAPALAYRGLVAFDAAGALLPAWVEERAEGLALVVDDRGARYPLTIDPIVQEAYLKASNTGANDSFGWSVEIKGDTAVVGAYREDSAATGVNGNGADDSAGNAGAVYVFVRSGATWTQQAYLKASNTGAGDNFGRSVAIAGDTIVVGAIGEDSAANGVNGNPADDSATSAGAAYVFVRSGTTWSQQAYLKASNTGAGDELGFSVDISADTIAIGAPREDSSASGVNGNQADNGASDAGAAYVFVRSGTTWSQQAYLKASNTGSGDFFGWSIAINGDTVIVGAELEDSAATGIDGNQADNGALQSGAAYVFVRNGASWTQQAYLKASNTGAGDGFARSVVLAGDTALVGAHYEDSSATGVGGDQSNEAGVDSGAAYVFVRNGASWSQQAYLKATNTGAGDRFGFAVALAADTAVVATPFEDSSATGVGGDQGNDGAPNSGAAYVYRRSGSTWSPLAYLKASNTEANDEFGQSVSISGDTVLVGAYDEDGGATGVNGNASDNSASSSGAAFVFDLDAPLPPAAFCFGDSGTCPCGNGGAPASGCDNPLSTGGVQLLATTFAPDQAGGGTATLQATGYPPAATPAAVVLRSTSQQPAVGFGDGLLCAMPPVVRLAATTASGGTSMHSLTHGAGAGTFVYQVWYRSQPASFCTPAAFNTSSGLIVLWP